MPGVLPQIGYVVPVFIHQPGTQDVLQFVSKKDDVVIKVIDGEDEKVLTEADKTVKVSLTDRKLTVTITDQAAADASQKKVRVEFKARIKDGITDEQLLAEFKNASGNPTTSVPNKANVTVNNEGNATNEVFVTPPPEEDVPEKMVQADHDKEATKVLSTLNARNEEFTYTISQKVPVDANYISFEDTLEDELEFIGKDGGAKLTYKDDAGKDAEIDAVVNVAKKKLTVTVDQTSVEDSANSLRPVFTKVVTLTFKAKISDNVTDDQLWEKYGSLEIPNEASLKFDPDNEGIAVIPKSIFDSSNVLMFHAPEISIASDPAANNESLCL